MTHKVGSFYDDTAAAQTFLNLLHPDLIANGWTREETNLDSGQWRWDVYKNAAANNINGIDFYIGFGRYYASGTAGVGNANQALYTTVFELWNGTTKQATNFPTWGAGVSGTNASGIPNYALTPRALPFNALIQPVTDITITNPGSGYTSPPAVSIAPTWNGAGATGTSVMELSAVVLGSGGSGYPASQSALSCTVTGGGGTGAVVTAATNGSGVVTSYTIVSRGTGYTSVPTVTVDGGGSGATSTVTLRVFDVTITAGGSGFNVSVTIGFSGGGGSGTVTATGTIDSGFAWQGRGMGANSTQYHYTVTEDMVAYSFRADGVTDTGGTYVGTYDRMLTAGQDPMPIGVITLVAAAGTVQPSSGYGFSTREPLRGASGPSSGLIYDCALTPRPTGGSGALIHTSAVANSYSQTGAVVEYVNSNHFCGRGQFPFARGVLRNVVHTSASSYTHGDLIYVQQGNTIKYARIVNAGHALMIV